MATQTLTEESTSRYVQAGDFRIHYNEAGTGDAVLFIHGGGPGASGWSNFNANIGPVSEHFRAILVDMPGFNKSDPVQLKEPRIKLNARVFRDMLDALDIDKAHFVGNSMGGATSVRFALDFPDRIGKLALMGAAGAGPSSFMPQPTEGISRLWEVYADPTPERFRRFVRAFVYDDSFMTDELIEQRIQGILANPEHLENMRNTPREFSSPGVLTHELHNVEADTLIFWGRDERAEALDNGLRFLQLIPNADMVIFSRCGHWAQLEQAAKFNKLLIDFLSR